MVCLEGNQSQSRRERACATGVPERAHLRVAGRCFIARDAQALAHPRRAAWSSIWRAGAAAPQRHRKAPPFWIRSRRLLAGEGVEASAGAMRRRVSKCASWSGCAAAPRSRLRCRRSRGSSTRRVNVSSVLEVCWLALCEHAIGALRTFHAEQPDEPGIDRGRLRRMTLPTLADAPARRDRRSRAAAGRTTQRTLLHLAGTSHHLGRARNSSSHRSWRSSPRLIIRYPHGVGEIANARVGRSGRRRWQSAASVRARVLARPR